ncbi:hypothetical protein F5Y04DRAFT_231042 [Hypomontagnella monticulosa]|nr:hypothetical protein F5Y04DRAFT_231042 [Hypomontagnella monticulosa]
MPCDCKRITFLYACRHKEREYHRCWRYNSKQLHPCVSMLFPACQASLIHIDIPRVCDVCFQYFSGKFGVKAAHRVSQRFLEYKQHKGLSREVLDPAAVPREAYISQYELFVLSNSGRKDKNQPFRPVSPMRATQPRAPPIVEPQRPPPVVHRTRRHDRPQPSCPIKSRFSPSGGTTSKKPPIPRKPVPARKPISGAIISRPLPRGMQPGSYIAALRNREAASAGIKAPVREYETTRPVENTEYNSYYQYPSVARGRPLSHSPLQPTPTRPTRPTRPRQLTRVAEDQNVRDRASECSLVKRITEAAETVTINGYPVIEEGSEISVPRISKAPKIPAWRRDTPHPEAGSHDSRRTRSDGHHTPPRRVEPMSLRTAPATFTRAKRSMDSLSSGPRSGSRDVVPVPPIRISGVRVPDSAHYYREHGIPSSAYLTESSNQDDEEEEEEEYRQKQQQGRDGAISPPAMLVSISSPSPEFSCAVQSCFCNDEDDDDDVCPSCRERRRLRRELQMKWI